MFERFNMLLSKHAAGYIGASGFKEVEMHVELKKGASREEFEAIVKCLIDGYAAKMKNPLIVKDERDSEKILTTI